MNVHKLKIWPEFYQAVIEGKKPFEVRRNDRGYQVGDLLLLREWIPDQVVPPAYTGRSELYLVTYVTRLPQLDGFVGMSIVKATYPFDCPECGAKDAFLPRFCDACGWHRPLVHEEWYGDGGHWCLSCDRPYDECRQHRVYPTIVDA